MQRYALSIEYNQQKEWCDVALISEMAIGTVGAGLFVVSVAAGFSVGALIAFLLLLIVKGLLLIVDLGKPGRFIKVLSRPGSSWVSKGAWGMLYYAVTAVVYLALVFFMPEANTLLVTVFAALSILGAVFLALYDSFTLIASKGVSFWSNNSAPIVFGASAAVGGIGAYMPLAFLLGFSESFAFMGPVSVAVSLIGLIALYTYVFAAKSQGGSALESATILTKGRLSGVFWFLAVVVGLVVPLVVGALPIFGIELPGLAFMLSGCCAVIGVFALRYCIMNAGVYGQVL